jgi:hypothetical protein
MRKAILIFLVLSLVCVSLVSAGDLTANSISLNPGTTDSVKTTVNLTNGYVTYTDKASYVAITSTIFINGTQFIPDLVKTDGSDLVWGTGEKSGGIIDDPTTKFTYSYDGSKLKETIVLKEEKNLSFRLVLKENNDIINLDNGDFRIVNKLSLNQYDGITILQPTAYDYNKNNIPIELTLNNKTNTLTLSYDKKILVFNETASKQKGIPQYDTTPITYPITIDPTWVDFQAHWIDTTTLPGETLERWNATGVSSSNNYEGGGGGGAGQVLTGNLTLPTKVVNVYAGFGGGAGSSSESTRGGDGRNTTFFNITAYGGSGGTPSIPIVLTSYASTGGAGAPNASGTKNSTASIGTGYIGGSGTYISATNYQGGGGGGVLSEGRNATTNKGGNGGSATTSNITGTLLTLGGGGGGGVYDNNAASAGQGGNNTTTGVTVGGSGAYKTTAATAPADSTGSGGGGRSATGGTASAGAGGVIIIRYTTPTPALLHTIDNTTISGQTIEKWSFPGDSTNWTAPEGVTSVWYLVVGGGGSGASGSNGLGGGGGSGGLLNGTINVTAGTKYNITIGRGGISRAIQNTSWGTVYMYGLSGAGGENSTFSTINAFGGGPGGSINDITNFTSGWATGGGGGVKAGTGGTPNQSGLNGTPGQGYNGSNGRNGTGIFASTYFAGGGGGSGQTAPGRTPSTDAVLQTGGNGTQINITGTLIWYSGGGAGGGNYLNTGGLGGGGNGSFSSTPTIPTEGGKYYGGGGGGGNDNTSGKMGMVGGYGYSGVVIIRYTNPSPQPPVASFSLNKKQVRFPAYITVNDTSTNTPTNWNWSWGDGTANSTTQNATHQYLKRGNWNIQLIAGNAYGNNTSVIQAERVVGLDQLYFD